MLSTLFAFVRKKISRRGKGAANSFRAGFNLLEMTLFLGIMAIVMGTVMAVVISTQESRIRQQSVAEVEQRGTQLLEITTKMMRRAEAILSPAVDATGSVLALQMNLNAEFPTVFARSASGNLMMAQKTSTSSLLNNRVRISSVVFRNVANTNIVFSYDLSTTIPLVKPMVYVRHFDGTATLFPDDQSEAGGCGSCPAPSCINHTFQWYHCQTEVCTLAPVTFSC